MNRGTALKWADMLRTTNHEFSEFQMGFMMDGKTYMSPVGILCEFLDKSAFKLAILISGVARREIAPEVFENFNLIEINQLQWNGSSCTISSDWIKKCKIKSEDMVSLIGNEEIPLDFYDRIYKIYNKVKYRQFDPVFSGISASKIIFDETALFIETYYEQL